MDAVILLIRLTFLPVLKCPHQGMGCVMHPATVIGENCIIYQHTTFGAVYGENKPDGVPVIGNNIMVGAGTSILGSVIIGNNAVIAAHSLVTKDVPDGAVIAGIPAEIKKYKTVIEENRQ